MDIMIKADADGSSWTMVDLLGRSMGQIVQRGSTFSLEPEGHALETMHAMKHGPIASLDDALREIETHTRGTCRLQEDNETARSLPVESLNASNDK